MRKIRLGLLLVLATTFVIAAATPAEARPRPARRASNFTANKTFGLGIMFGSPTGLSGKYFLGADTALDFGLGVYGRGYRGDGYGRGIHLHADFLWHPVNLVSTAPFELPLYLGIGGRLWDHNRRRDYDDHIHLGVRAPIGIAFDFNNVPLDIFVEFALVFDLLIDDDHGYLDVNGAFGIRYWF
jgi:hypothetical protein